MVKLYVEGAGDSSALKTVCRAGFSTFISKAGITKRPRVVACGSRANAYDRFCTALKNGEKAMLLVDSEQTVNSKYQQGSQETWQPWAHLKTGDHWDKPQHSTDTDCHLMVQVMESWFLADRDVLKAFFGQGFNENSLPSTPVEEVAKDTLYNALKQASRACKTKAVYGKNEHSFKLLALIDPEKVTRASPWAKRFVDALRKKMDA